MLQLKTQNLLDRENIEAAEPVDTQQRLIAMAKVRDADKLIVIIRAISTASMASKSGSTALTLTTLMSFLSNGNFAFTTNLNHQLDGICLTHSLLIVVVPLFVF